MRRRTDPGLSLAALLLLTACGTPAQPGNEARPAADAPAGQGLETLARESGALADAPSRDPAGAYGHSYEGGRDRLCLVPDGAERFRFAVEVRFGSEEYCKGQGVARRSADTLILDFDGGHCTVVARYEGDRILLPGALDIGCASLCSRRGSLAGVSLPRIADGAAAARAMTDVDQRPLCD